MEDNNNHDKKQLRLFTREEVNQEKERALVIVGKFVLDVTDFIRNRLHPGGSDVLAQFIGLDATGAFEAMGHSMRAKQQALQFVIGKILEKS